MAYSEQHYVSARKPSNGSSFVQGETTEPALGSVLAVFLSWSNWSCVGHYYIPVFEHWVELIGIISGVSGVLGVSVVADAGYSSSKEGKGQDRLSEGWGWSW